MVNNFGGIAMNSVQCMYIFEDIQKYVRREEPFCRKVLIFVLVASDFSGEAMAPPIQYFS